MALAKAEAAKLKEIFDDPIKWAQAFLRTFDPREKKIVPWTARWYQVDVEDVSVSVYQVIQEYMTLELETEFQ